MIKPMSALAAVLLMIASSTGFAQTTWNFDKAHTSIGFSVTHLVITQVEGRFKEFGGSVTAQGDSFDNSVIEFWAEIASIDTDNETRDSHLLKDDFFNAEKYPRMTFKGKSMRKVSEKKYELTGDLTIRDVTKTVTFDVDYAGTVKDPWGNTRAGFKLNGELDRFDYNLKWNVLTEAGGAVAGRVVTLIINIELVKAA